MRGVLKGSILNGDRNTAIHSELAHTPGIELKFRQIDFFSESLDKLIQSHDKETKLSQHIGWPKLQP